MDNKTSDLEKTIKKLQEDYQEISSSKWYESIAYKIILLFPVMIFLISFLAVNSDKSILDLIYFISFGFVLIALGLVLYFLSKKINFK